MEKITGKKAWFKRLPVWIVALVIIIGIFTITNMTESPDKIELHELTTKKENEAVATETVPVNKSTVTESEIDTTVFEYALATEVTDAIDINDHVTVFVEMREDISPGLATQHVVNQTYDFIQQDDVIDAKTITIAVKQGDIKIAQFTVNTANFVPNDDIPMTQLVMTASEIDFMTDEVKEFGKTMEAW